MKIDFDSDAGRLSFGEFNADHFYVCGGFERADKTVRLYFEQDEILLVRFALGRVEFEYGLGVEARPKRSAAVAAAAYVVGRKFGQNKVKRVDV